MASEGNVSTRDDYEAWLTGRIRGMRRLSREYAIKDRLWSAAELDIKRRVLIEALDEYQRLRVREGQKE